MKKGFILSTMICLICLSCNQTNRSIEEDKTSVKKDRFIEEAKTSVGTGLWELQSYKDQFGEETGEKYLTIIGVGKFSNSATTGSELSAILFVDKESFSIRLVEYNHHVVKDDDMCSMDIKDSEGQIYSNWNIRNSDSGNLTIDKTWNSEKYEQLKGMLEKGGEITFFATMGKYSISKYQFKFDVTGYNNAIKYIE